jgi:hypothetical protein
VSERRKKKTQPDTLLSERDQSVHTPATRLPPLGPKLAFIAFTQRLDKDLVIATKRALLIRFFR